ncbi:hypothetical protein M8C21_003163 [Ambrosia artemisiifolia]|uniref:CDT1 Geminin-binding domain-containing protein n=1 Tax=Ambrosia artemisiifolia TaxID=4212 RepID=A0AAD5C4N5_AMBAR|nr:hypothetical protein M8C21_003163 [Ambrosia artemisiifolia]
MDHTPMTTRTPEKPSHAPRKPLTRRHSLHISDRKPSISSDPLTSVTETVISPFPEKYETLNTFFDRLVSSIRLLKLKRTMPTFTNISRMIESLTDRSFDYHHLAQLKFILPEAIEIKKILVRDDRTSCMKPDLHISLNFSIIQDDDDYEKLRSESVYALLSKLFRSRLSSFCESNPQGDDVPEEKLPEPFNRSNRRYSNSNPIYKVNMESVQDITNLNPVFEQQPMAASLMPKSFKRRFSKQVLTENVEPVNQESSVLSTGTQVDHEVGSDCVSDVVSAVKLFEKLPKTPVKGFAIDGTPVKLVFTPYSALPAQSTQPVRCFMTPNEEDSVKSPSKLTRRASSKRSITFDTPVKNRTSPVNRVSTDDDDVLSDDLLASIRANELKALEEKKPEISQAKWRKQMVAGLPKLFDTLLFFFQSAKRTVITKEELMNIITSNQLEIVDRREADEQLRLLQELAPEWIYEKMASSGDHLICVNKISSTESIRTRLSSAN